MNRTRAGALAGMAIVVALLGGCAAPHPGGTGDPAPSRTATPTPTPAAASKPTSRVPLTCDQLVPPAVVEAAFRAPVTAVTADPVHNPAAYADTRDGGLRCTWAEGDPAEPLGQKKLYGWVTVVPGVTHQALEDYRGSIDVGGLDEPLGTEPDTYSMCSPTFFQLCGFFARTPDYGVHAGVWDYGAATYDSQSAWVDAVSSAVLPAVRALPTPEPLWQPEGATLRGAQNCDQLIGEDALSAILGEEATVSKSDDGENALSTMGVNRLVGSYNCIWSTRGPSSVSVSASVLPGGASYAESTRPADATDVSGLGESAYRTGTELDVIAAHGWVQVEGSDSVDEGKSAAIMRQVLINVGYTG
ncbi:hypothetical protein [Leifsonia sp. fls2-241-R2A-40a]|uniref:hypothetical protein n=1 Tax=Leifsonia sp. fls2-241-R2A-40a TaxID=3040290 RepID=UPI00254DC09E|nr:hypothetical protein [Leifsonia sp. fls2-241-R2A-40a]